MPKRSNAPGRRPRSRRRTPPPTMREPERRTGPAAVEERPAAEPAAEGEPEGRGPERRERAGPYVGPDYGYVLADLRRIAVTTLIIAAVLVVAVLILG